VEKFGQKRQLVNENRKFKVRILAANPDSNGNGVLNSNKNKTKN